MNEFFFLLQKIEMEFSHSLLYMQIGQYISSNGGVVAAEELAPYLDVETSGASTVGSIFLYKFFSPSFF